MFIPDLRQPYGLNNDTNAQPVPWGIPGMDDPRVLQASYSPQDQQQTYPQPGLDLQHVNDVMNQYIQSKQQQQNGGLLQQILSNRMQPQDQDIMTSGVREAQSYASPGGFKAYSPEGQIADRITQQLSPYSDALKLAQQGENLSGTQMQNQITAQTGLPMAQTELAKKQLALMIAQKTGLPMAEAELQAKTIANQYAPAMDQADIAGKNASTNYMNTALQRALTEKAFDYQNNPQMQQANLMAQYLRNASGLGGGQAPTPAQNGFGGMSTPSTPDAPQGGQIPPSAPQPQQQGGGFNPMGAMLAKQFGLENMQIGRNGQPEPIPGVPTAGQKEVDKNFADALQTYQNAGGAKRTADTIKTIQDVISQLRTGKITTGGLLDRNALNNEGAPTEIGRNLDPSVLVARNLISSAILPQAKPLFGARVTNFDAQSLVNSKGLDPMADTNTNISKLQNLLAEIQSGQSDLQNGGSYFNQKGTLSGYTPQVQQQAPTGGATHIYDPSTGQLVPAQ